MRNASGLRLSSLVCTVIVVLTVALGACAPEAALAPDDLLSRADELPCDGAPLKIDDGYALVPVSIGDHEEAFLFLLDTGAGRTLLTPATQYALGLNPRDGEESTIIGATGEEQHISHVLDSIRVGPFTRYDMSATVLDLYRFHRSDVPYAGVLGNDFLKEINAVYNLPERRICFYENEEELSDVRLDSLHRVPFYRQLGDTGFITFEIRIGGEPARALFDTGSSHTVFNSRAAEQDGAHLDAIRVRSETFGIGVGEATDTRMYSFRDMRARDVVFEPMEISVADLPIFRTLDRRNRPYVLMGNDLIQNRVVYIQYSSRELFFSDPVE